MYRLAKAGFTQSYTYFTWRNTADELRQYVTELTTTDEREFFRPNFWPNTPDILPEHLQIGGRPTFVSRLVLAATLSSNYGIYGPAFELGEYRALRQGGEEYLDSEKYQQRDWELDDPDSLRPLIALVNQARRENPALQRTNGVRFLETGNPALLAYLKLDEDGDNIIVCVVVSLDPHHTQTAWIDLPLAELGLEEGRAFQVHDLLGGARIRLVRGAQLRRARSVRRAGAHLPGAPPGAHRARFRLLPVTPTVPEHPHATRAARSTPPAGSPTGTRTRSSTRCTSAPSRTRTATASATSAA